MPYNPFSLLEMEWTCWKCVSNRTVVYPKRQANLQYWREGYL
jgi:hypothetical protein